MPTAGPGAELAVAGRRFRTAGQRPYCRCLICLSPGGRAWVCPEILLEVVDHRVSGTATTEDQVCLREQRAVLADPAEVIGGLAGHVISDEPPAAAGLVGTCDREERVER